MSVVGGNRLANVPPTDPSGICRRTGDGRCEGRRRRAQLPARRARGGAQRLSAIWTSSGPHEGPPRPARPNPQCPGLCASIFHHSAFPDDHREFLRQAPVRWRDRCRDQHHIYTYIQLLLIFLRRSSGKAQLRSERFHYPPPGPCTTRPRRQPRQS